MHSAVQLIELGAIILALGLLGAVSVRFSISPIPLYLIAGLAFGSGGILPLTTSEDFVSIGAEVGVILLLFTLGLEYTAGELVSTLRTSAPTGLADLVLNAAPGVAAALLLGWGPVAAVAMGGITYVTSSGITAKVIGDLGWLGNRETPAVLSVLVFEDLAMAAYLPILTTLLAGAGLIGGATALGVAAATITVILFVALRHGTLVERFVASPSEEVLLLKVLGLTLLVAGVAQQLQVSAAVGAFLVGIALSGSLAHTAQKLLSPLRDLFAAVFFVFFGLHTDPSDLPPVLGIAALLAAAGIITKMGTGWIAAARAGIATTGRLRAGASLVPRGEFNIVIAGLAVSAGTNPRLGPLAAAYVLILAVAGPVIARGTEPLAGLLRTRRARRRAPQTDDDVPLVSRPVPHSTTSDTGPTPTIS
ncbi:potassium/proton antiporter membrane subunit, CPA2 family [Actinomadura meyerae]|jgi:CPA2 family monovalent cation:H+ antiporter-2|uniref:Potassium/proton antiporter membrane subunit, CPA2 family n=1 Tax=Actinomadura meyerae TaxID=240840 RepID=A0A239IX09_9ACTN|nr:cation:proton antiporter [Actinomadura meyerae]SNS98150.1 potassium/proton antiporter membrane subunit, CPA2 family [Actinomadura meyerae]